jgi:hypothetical protein
MMKRRRASTIILLALAGAGLLLILITAPDRGSGGPTVRNSASQRARGEELAGRAWAGIDRPLAGAHEREHASEVTPPALRDTVPAHAAAGSAAPEWDGSALEWAAAGVPPSTPREVAERYEHERDDPMRTAETRHYVENMLEELGAAAELAEVACRSSVCKVELHFDTDADASDLQRLALPDAEDVTVVLRRHDERLAAVVYLAPKPPEPSRRTASGDDPAGP